MAKIYLRKILGGTMELAQVPARWRVEVEALLGSDRDQAQGGELPCK